MGPEDRGRRFATTRWSVVLSAGNRQTQEGRRALDELCQTYWYPLYAYARRKGFNEDQAQDIVQGFLAQFIERDTAAGARREKGKFRTFLMVCLRNYMANFREAQGTIRRGGGRQRLSLDVADAEQRYQRNLADTATPEHAFERNWAIAVLEQAMAQVRGEFAARGRQRIFEALSIYLTGDEPAPDYATTAAALAMSETAVKVAVHRLRLRYREAVEEEIRQTLDGGDDDRSLDEEIADLLGALSESRCVP